MLAFQPQMASVAPHFCPGKAAPGIRIGVLWRIQHLEEDPAARFLVLLAFLAPAREVHKAGLVAISNARHFSDANGVF